MTSDVKAVGLVKHTPLDFEGKIMADGERKPLARP